MARTYNTVGWQDGTVLQPAQVTIQGTTYNVEPQVVSGTTPVNATNLRKMDNEIKKIIEEDIPGVLGVELISVGSTAPVSFSTGDKYYNTSSNKIFTAEDSTTWDSGVTPTEGIIYTVFENQNIYMYNGTTLVSVGGGAGGETLPVGSEIDFDGTSADIPTGWEQVAVYSTNEVKTGDTWIDGKPIWRKVITGSAPSTDWADFAQLSSLNIDSCVSIRGALYQDDNWNVPINTYESPDYYILVSWTKTYISYKKNGWTSNPTMKLTIEYTKSTV